VTFHPLRAGDVSLFSDQLVTISGAVGRDSRGLSGAPRGAPWPPAAAPPVYTPWPFGGWVPMVISPTRPVKCLACARVDEPGGALPLPAMGAVGLSSPCRCSFGRTAGGGCEPKSVLETPEHLWVVRSPAFELALSVGRSGWEPGRPPTQLLSTTSVVNRTVSYLNGCLPRAERAARVPAPAAA
jgi:hypothetical protein